MMMVVVVIVVVTVVVMVVMSVSDWAKADRTGALIGDKVSKYCLATRGGLNTTIFPNFT